MCVQTVNRKHLHNLDRENHIIASGAGIDSISNHFQGMTYLHNSDVSVHGKLRSCNCLIDGRFVLKISDFGLRTLTSPSEIVKDQSYYNS